MRDGTTLGLRAACRRSAFDLDALAALLAGLFVAELILGGPGYWQLGGIGIRKVLFVLNVAVFAVTVPLNGSRLHLGSATLILAIAAFLSIWVLLIPIVRNPGQVSMAIQDGLPLMFGLLAVLYWEFFRRRPADWVRIVQVATVCLSVTAAANVALWALGTSSEEGNFAAQAIALYWFTLGDLQLSPPLYVGLMPDGFFRAMWITGITYMPALLMAVAARRWSLAALFGAGLLATYTRSLWIFTALAFLLAQILSDRRARYLSRRTVLLSALAVSLGSVSLALGLSLDDESALARAGVRLFSTFSDDSADERFEQVRPLIAAWLDAPMLGNGFGAAASLIRSDDAPYSYELTLLALLMKLGGIGMVLLASLLVMLWVEAATRHKLRTRTESASLAAIVALLAAGSTNPYLLNFVGMSTLSFLFLHIRLARQAFPHHDRKSHHGLT